MSRYSTHRTLSHSIAHWAWGQGREETPTDRLPPYSGGTWRILRTFPELPMARLTLAAGTLHPQPHAHRNGSVGDW